MSADFIVVRPSLEQDPDGSRLRSLMQLHLLIERVRQIRVLLAHALCLLGGPIWLAAARPAWVPHRLRAASLHAWAVCVAVLLLAAISEWRMRRRRALLLEKLGSQPVFE